MDGNDIPVSRFVCIISVERATEIHWVDHVASLDAVEVIEDSCSCRGSTPIPQQCSLSLPTTRTVPVGIVIELPADLPGVEICVSTHESSTAGIVEKSRGRY
jgi:hypothetical protein